MIRIRTLGGAELLDDEGAEIRSVLTGSKRLALFVYLVLARPHGFHRRDTLLALLWPELDGARSRAALNQAVHLLRRGFGADVIESRGDELGITAGAVWCDAVAFEAALDEGQAARALELYRGGLLPGFFVAEAPEFERWLDAERTRLAGLASAAARDLVERADAAGDLAAAERWSRRALDLSPYDEQALVGLMRARHGAGDRAGAIRAFEDFRRRMREDLELEPAAETLAVLEEVREAGVGRPPAPRRRREDVVASSPSVSEERALATAVLAPQVAGPAVGEADGRAVRRRGGRVAMIAAVALAAAIAVLFAVLGPWRDRASAPGEEGAPPTRVAVLYFADASAGKELGYLSEGLAAALIDQLAHVRGLSVVSQNGVRPFRGSSLPVDSIGRRLGVGLLVGGTVAQSGEKLRVTVELVDSRSGTALASRILERPAGELFALLDDVSREVAAFLRKAVGEEVELTRWRAGTKSTEAWRRLQRAAELYGEILTWEKAGDFAAERLQLALADSLAQEAERLDPRWPEPEVVRARLGVRRALLAAVAPAPGAATVTEALQAAESHAARALAIAPSDAAALQSRGTSIFWRWLLAPPPGAAADSLLARAERDLRRSVAVDAGRPEAHLDLSAVLFARGNFVDTRVEARRAFDSDAFLAHNKEILTRLYLSSFELGDDETANRWCEEIRLHASGTWLYPYCALMLLGWSPTGDHDPRKALLLYEAYVTGAAVDGAADPPQIRARTGPTLAVLTAAVLARAARPDSAEAMLRRARAGSPDPELLPLEAGVRVLLDQPDSAIALLGAYLRANPTARPRVAHGRMFLPLHGRPDWTALLEDASARRPRSR